MPNSRVPAPNTLALRTPTETDVFHVECHRKASPNFEIEPEAPSTSL